MNANDLSILIENNILQKQKGERRLEAHSELESYMGINSLQDIDMDF
jgi:hypothetical protein